MLAFFGTARDAFYGPPEGPRRDLTESAPPAQSNMQNPLFLKQAIIVLREELEYFAIPPKGTAVAAGEDAPKTDDAGHPNKALLKLKVDSGNALLDRKSIFTALQRNVNRENNVAEQHLIDMLCMRCVVPARPACPPRAARLLSEQNTDPKSPCVVHSGFEREDTWGYRSLEPNRCCIASIALVLLKTGITHPPITDPSSPQSTTDAVDRTPKVNAQQLATAQKLLLFWRKPAVSLLSHFSAAAASVLGSSFRALIRMYSAAQVLVGRDGRDAQRGDFRGARDQGLGATGMDARAESHLSPLLLHRLHFCRLVSP